MKKYFLFLSLVAGISINAQIKVMSVPEKVEEKKPYVPYDSLTNMVSINGSFDHLIGQKIYYAFIDPHAKFYQYVLQKGSLNKRGKSIEIDPKEMLGKYFYLQGIDYGKEPVLYLKQDSLVSVITYKMSNFDNIDDVWVVVGHYEKIKSLYEGQELIYVGRYSLWNTSTRKRNHYILNGSRWMCKRVEIDQNEDCEGKSRVVIVMDNDKWGEHYCYYDLGGHIKSMSFCDGKEENVFLTVSNYEKQKDQERVIALKRREAVSQKFGEANAAYIAYGYVKIGMTESMCLEALGVPDRKNQTTYSYGTREQWVYEKGNYKYLYFENGKLTAIQN